MNPTAVTIRRYTWDGTLPAGRVQDANGLYRFTLWECGGCANSTVPYVRDPTKLVSVTGGRNTSIDPNLKLGRADEFMADLDQEIGKDTSIRFTAVRKRTGNFLQVYNRALPFSAGRISSDATSRAAWITSYSIPSALFVASPGVAGKHRFRHSALQVRGGLRQSQHAAQFFFQLV